MASRWSTSDGNKDWGGWPTRRYVILAWRHEDKRMGFLEITLVLNLSFLGITLGSALVITRNNSRSRNLALATGTLAGAIIFFCTQLYFELQPSISYDFINTELTIDRAKPEIRQWVYGPGAGRITAEPYASAWLAQNNPNAFLQDRGKVATDLVLFSLAYFLATPEAQFWETRKHSITDKHGSGIVRFHTYPDRTCRVIGEAELAALLSRAGNLFAGAKLLTQPICFPPGTVLEISPKSLTIRNGVCEISFTVESPGVNFENPGEGDRFPQLPNGGGPRFETRTIGLDVETTYLALRAQNHDGAKYREWTSAIVGGAREWFEK